MRISDWISDVCSSDLSKGAKLMTKFKFGAPKVEPPPQELDCAEIERIKLKHPGEVRCAIIAGDLFELYIKRFVEGYCYQVIPDKSSGKFVVQDWKGVGKGKSELVRVDFGGRQNLKKK